jgi:hypothetical protein
MTAALAGVAVLAGGGLVFALSAHPRAPLGTGHPVSAPAVADAPALAVVAVPLAAVPPVREPQPAPAPAPRPQLASRSVPAPAVRRDAAAPRSRQVAHGPQARNGAAHHRSKAAPVARDGTVDPFGN